MWATVGFQSALSCHVEDQVMPTALFERVRQSSRLFRVFCAFVGEGAASPPSAMREGRFAHPAVLLFIFSFSADHGVSLNIDSSQLNLVVLSLCSAAFRVEITWLGYPLGPREGIELEA